MASKVHQGDILKIEKKCLVKESLFDWEVVFNTIKNTIVFLNYSILINYFFR